MEYFEPKKKNEIEIINSIRSKNLSDDERVSILLSAIYYCEPQFSGDLLIDEFVRASNAQKLNLIILFLTYYQINESTYRIDEIIGVIINYKNELGISNCKIEDVIDGLQEFSLMFKSPNSKN